MSAKVGQGTGVVVLVHVLKGSTRVTVMCKVQVSVCREGFVSEEFRTKGSYVIFFDLCPVSRSIGSLLVHWSRVRDRGRLRPLGDTKLRRNHSLPLRPVQSTRLPVQTYVISMSSPDTRTKTK